ncbi:unnamed protein product [Cunninghamella blakesleeana]
MENTDNSPECSGYFWCRPSEVDSETSSITSPYSNNVFELEELSYFIQRSSSSSTTSPYRPNNSGINSPQNGETSFWDDLRINTNLDGTSSTNNNKNKNNNENGSSNNSSGSSTPKATMESYTTDKYKRKQTKMLLVSLIESFCRIYGDSPDANRKVFFLICQTLKSLGIIDTEFIDEMASVRSTFQRTFQKLFYAALHTVQTDAYLDQPQRLLITTNERSTSNNHLSTLSDSSTSTASSSSSSSSSTPSSSTPNNSSAISLSINPLLTPSALSSPSGWLDPPSSSSTASTTTNRSTSTNHSSKKVLFDLSIHHSRYHNDFVELCLLGRGGFAKAYKVKNKLDGIDYAIKKVPLGADLEIQHQRGNLNPYKKIFREIKHLARLEHPNVIRYYASWLEYENNIQLDDEDEEDFDEDDEDDSYFNSKYSKSNNRNDFSFKNQLQHPVPKKKKELLYEQGSISTPTSPTKMTIPKSMIPGGWTLFIQMQLCQKTLHDYIEVRNRDYGVVDPQRNISLFTQILLGTAYIHEQGLIHRDLKPSNIFLTLPSHMNLHDIHFHQKKKIEGYEQKVKEIKDLDDEENINGHEIEEDEEDEDGEDEERYLSPSHILWEECIPKIGDFGLAAQLIDEDAFTSPSSTNTTTNNNSSNKSNGNHPSHSAVSSPTLKDVVKSSRKKLVPLRRTHTIGVGTRTYASPEQLAYSGKPYNEKVDIYSLGIILFELYQPFSTFMERADAINKLKNAMLPDGFVEKYPKEVSYLFIYKYK